MPVDCDTMRTLQQTDQALQFIHKHMSKQENKSITSQEARALATFEFLTAADGLLYCIANELQERRTRVRTAMRLVIPMTLREQIMRALHSGMLAAHPGIVRMIDKLRMHVWWPGMYADVVRYVTTCPTCQRVKAAPSHVSPRPVHLPTRPWQILAIDAVGPLPKTKRGNEYIIDVVCCFTHYVEGWAVPSIDMVSIARAVIDKVVCRYGLFDTLVSDRGSVFVGTLAAHVFKALRIKRVQTTAQHPQSNGMIERFHETLKTTLKLWSHEVADEWDDLLQQAIFAYNTAYHTTLQEVPHYLAHGYDARLPLDELLGTKDSEHTDVHQFAADAVERLHMTYARITSIMQEINAERQEDSELARKLQLSVGDDVWLYEHATKKGENAKLKTRWLGPYKILEKKSDVVFVIDREGQAYSVNVARLKKANKRQQQQLPETEKERQQYQLQLIEDELKHLATVQQQLLAQQKQKQHQKQRILAATHVAKRVIASDSKDDESSSSSSSSSAFTTADEHVIEQMCMIMCTYEHNTAAWQQ
jgi:transposase InsO family protein